ncbi:MAG: heavy-metal-associated domain-containing protein [Pirellulaceae bacterium]
MRSLVYAIAVLAAIGIAIGIAVRPSDEAVTGSATAVSADTNVRSEAGTLVLAVPDMMCEFSCFPKIKETLESSEAVKEVNLAKQKEEGTVDNRQVIVNYEAGFNVNEAIKVLKAEGYDNAEVVQ